MNRLTRPELIDGENTYSTEHVYVCCDEITDKETGWYRGGAIRRLGEYEDTELSPSEVESLKRHIESSRSRKTRDDGMIEKRELREAAEPLLDYLYAHGSPHHCVIVTQRGVELYSSEVAEEFDLRDCEEETK